MTLSASGCEDDMASTSGCEDDIARALRFRPQLPSALRGRRCVASRCASAWRAGRPLLLAPTVGIKHTPSQASDKCRPTRTQFALTPWAIVGQVGSSLIEVDPTSRLETCKSQPPVARTRLEATSTTIGTMCTKLARSWSLKEASTKVGLHPDCSCETLSGMKIDQHSADTTPGV